MKQDLKNEIDVQKNNMKNEDNCIQLSLDLIEEYYINCQNMLYRVAYKKVKM